MSLSLRTGLIVIALLCVAGAPLSCQQRGIRIGSKKFTESVILGELLSERIRELGHPVSHFQELGGTRLIFNSLVEGELDAYPEYTGTIDQEILAGRAIGSAFERNALLAEQGIAISSPLGFSNNYALGMRRDRAVELGIEAFSDLNRFPELQLGFSNEFLDRGDGWPALREAYGFRHRAVQGMDHDIAYRQLEQGAIDVIDVYTTDAKIKTMDLIVLRDDRQFFPSYEAVILYRADLARRGFADVAELLAHFPGGPTKGIDEAGIIALNHAVEVDGSSENQVARQYLRETLGLEMQPQPPPTMLETVATRTAEHLDLVRKSLIPAILIGIPLGIGAYRSSWAGPLILGVVGIIQTVPALALLVLVMPLVTAAGLSSLGVGSVTAVLALFLYSLLPIVAGTHAGLAGIAREFLESADSIGMTGWQRLTRVEMPLASRSILSGVRTAAVINVGFATLGALIGAGGYGQPILTGIRLDDFGLILQGAIPAAGLALMVLALAHFAERLVIPRGLRLPVEPSSG